MTARWRNGWSTLMWGFAAVLLALVIALGGYYGWCQWEKFAARRAFARFAAAAKHGSNADSQEALQEFLGFGPSGVVPVAVTALEYGAVFPRYEPEPVEILRRFPVEAHRELLHRLELTARARRLDAGGAKSRADVLERRSCLVYGLLDVADDWTFLDDWLVDAQAPERARQIGTSAERINRLVNDRLAPLRAPRLLNMRAPTSWELNSEFVAWWHLHKDEVLSRSIGWQHKR